jgi:hypothetical protein
MKRMKTTSKAIVWVILVFLMGVLFGGALTLAIYQPSPLPWADRKSREDRLNEFVGRMSTELELDQEQREQFHAALIESKKVFREAHRAANRRARQETREKLRSILRSDQLERFDELMAKVPAHHPLGRGWKSKR